MSKQKILIVEDEIKIAKLLQDYLEMSGYDTSMINEGLSVINFIRQAQPDLVLLDLMLPGKDGVQLCKEIREFSNIPIIMVTARVEEIDRLLGLEVGADDYICKPFSPREVVARVKTVLRRIPVSESQSVHATALNEATLEASFLGNPLVLTAIEFRLLSILCASPGQIFSRDQLIDRAYDDSRVVSGRTIDSHIKKLRKKFSAFSDQEIIQSVYSVGYRYLVE